MTHEPQDFARCLGKQRSLSQVMQKEPIDGVYECKSCLRSIPNSPSHPESKTHCALIDPWPDFTPCENFVALRWDAPVSDEALHKMAMSEIQSLSPCVRKAVIQDLELGLLGSAFKQINQQQGWTMDGNFDYALKTRRTLLHDTFQHEMKRRKHAACATRLRPMCWQPSARLLPAVQTKCGELTVPSRSQQVMVDRPVGGGGTAVSEL